MTAHNEQLVAMLMKIGSRMFAAHIFHSSVSSQLLILFSIVTLIQAQQYCLILLTTMNNVSSRISRANTVSVGKAVKRLTKILYSTLVFRRYTQIRRSICIQSSKFSFEYLLIPPRSAPAAVSPWLAPKAASRPPRPPTRRNVTRCPWKSECAKTCVTIHLTNQLHTQKSHNL